VTAAARVAAAVSLVVLAGTGCGSLGGSPQPSRPVPAAVSRCSVDATVPMTPMNAREAGEPYLSVPTPDGWEMSHNRDSALVRGGLVNTGLRAKGFTPSVVITLADVSEDSTNARQAVATEQVGVEAQPGVTVTSVQDGTVCGYPSRTLSYKHGELSGTTLIVAGTDRSNKTWVSTLLVQTADPDDVQFLRDRAVILDKFQFIVAGAEGVTQ